MYEFTLLVRRLIAVTVEPVAAKDQMSAEEAVGCYQYAMREAILMGGCTASRALFAGAMAGAILQREHTELVCIPPKWLKRLDQSSQVVVVGKKFASL